MEKITEESREIPVIAETDVLIVGGGTAGLPAALAAAGSGVDVLVLERYGYVGGASTGGLVITIPEDRQDPILREMEGRLLEDKFAAHIKKDWLVWCPEAVKWLGAKMLAEGKVRMLFHSWCVGCVMEDNIIKAVIVESKAGRQAIKAKVIVDCTGDGDIAAFSGAPFFKGDENGKMQQATMMFTMANVDESKFVGRKGQKPPWNFHCEMTGFYPGYLNIWGGRVDGIDGTNPWDLTKAENDLRKQVFDLIDWMKKTLAGCEDAYIVQTSPQLGIRETRRIDGEYCLSKADWDARTAFDDHIGFAYAEKPVPYRAILPKKVDNLLAAGRCISVERDIFDPIRLIPACMVTGHAAGKAAALSIKDNVSPRKLNIEKLQASLKDAGVPFP